MDKTNPLEGLPANWAKCLANRGHRVRPVKRIARVFQSRNNGQKRFLWLLLSSRSASKSLNQTDWEETKTRLARAKADHQQAHVVIRFRGPERKIIVLPATRALKKGWVLPAKGGIRWED